MPAHQRPGTSPRARRAQWLFSFFVSVGLALPRPWQRGGRLRHGIECVDACRRAGEPMRGAAGGTGDAMMRASIALGCSGGSGTPRRPRRARARESEFMYANYCRAAWSEWTPPLCNACWFMRVVYRVSQQIWSTRAPAPFEPTNGHSFRRREPFAKFVSQRLRGRTYAGVQAGLLSGPTAEASQVGRCGCRAGRGSAGGPRRRRRSRRRPRACGAAPAVRAR